MVCPQQRLEDFTSQLEVSTAEQAQALEDELQSWYFGVGATFKIEACGSSASSGGQIAGRGQQVDRSKISEVDARNRPPVDVLEQAAAGVKAQLTAGGAFQPPPPTSAILRDGGFSSGQAAAGGGGRGVAAARANRGGALGPPVDC